MTALLRSIVAQIEQELSPGEQDELARRIEREFTERRAKNVRQRQLDAIERLSQFAAGLPPVDAVELVRQGREELANRALT